MQTMTPSRALFLTGFMGAGKTSVGAALARRLGCAFYDLDAVIVERTGKTVAQIFASQGEAGFRQAEAEALRALLVRVGQSPAVVALGGGSLLSAENARAVRDARGVVVALDAPLAVLLERARAARGTRPLAQDEAGFRALYQARRAQYLAADVVVDSGAADIEHVAAQVESSISTLIGDRREKR
jgi:shikimate kinase